MSKIEYLKKHGMEYRVTDLKIGDQFVISGVSWTLNANGKKEVFLLNGSSVLFDAAQYRFEQINENAYLTA